MDVRHDDPDLERLEVDERFTAGLSTALVRAFRKVMNLIRRVENETKLYEWKALRFEKLSGKRAHQRSLRLNVQFRLIVELEKAEAGNRMVVKGIEDYH